MNWARQNPFVAGLLAVVFLGLAVFGWLIATALSRNAEIDEAYRTQVNELQRLERLQPYPEESGRGLLEEKKKEYAAAVTTLQAQLASEASPPLETAVTPTEFQGRLREAVERLVRNARSANIALPNDFYLGFEPYRTGLPTPGAAPLLAFQLKRCEEIVRVLLASRIDALTAFKRAPLPDETTGAMTAPAPAPIGGTAKPGAAASAAPLVITYPVELEFRASPNAFRVVMDELVKSPSFHLVRALRVKNEREKGPSRDESPAEAAEALAATATPTTPPAPAPAVPPPAAPTTPARGGRGGSTGTAGVNVPEPALPERQTLRYVVGMEKINAALRVEAVRFTTPPPAPP